MTGRVALEHPHTGRWYIAMGYAGFNSPANNRDGYATCEGAMKAHKRYAGPDHGLRLY